MTQALPLAQQLPRLHSVVLGNRASWRALPSALNLDTLEDLDLQVSHMWHCSPAVMMPASACTYDGTQARQQPGSSSCEADVKWRVTLTVHGAWSSVLSLCDQACMFAQTRAAAEQLPTPRLAVRAQHAELHMRSRAPSVLLQDCYLAVIPTRLRPATALRRLRIADEGAGLLITSADLDTLSALRSLTFLSLTQAGSCTQY